MKNPVEQINHIVSVDDFINFVTQLAMDAKEHPEEWVNPTIADYLEQIASWVDDCSCVEESFAERNVDSNIGKNVVYGKDLRINNFPIHGNRIVVGIDHRRTRKEG